MERVAEARASAAAVQSQFYPVLTLNPSATRSRFPTGTSSGKSAAGASSSASSTPTPTPGPTPAPTPASSAATATAATPKVSRSTSYQIPFDLSYEVDIWGRARRAVEAAKAQTQVSVDDLEVVRQTLLADLAQDYFNLRSFEEQDRITQRNVEAYRQQLDLTQLQFKAGLANEINVLQARTLLEATQALEVDLRRQRADLEHAIAILLGRPPANFSLRVRERPPIQPVIPAGLPADLLRRRPDVAEAEQNLVAASAQIGVAKANLFPAVRLSATAGLEGASFAQIQQWSNHFWTIGSTISAPIFEGGLLWANLRQARARYRELEATYRGAVLGAFRDVEDSLTDLHMRAEESQAQTRAVASAREYLQLTELQYQQGLINYLQVIDADRTLLTNELALAQILNQRMVSTVLFIKAIGGGWDSQAPGAPPAHH
jgi:multidrug efflux system outer membrane protein